MSEKKNEVAGKRGQISELAKGGLGVANGGDGQDFDPTSDSPNEEGSNDEDMAKNRGAATAPTPGEKRA